MNAPARWLILLAALVLSSLSAQDTCPPNEQAAIIPQPAYLEQIVEVIRTDLYRGQQAFTSSMLEAIRKATPDENIIFSPYSTYHALLLAYLGARNHTEKELTQALHLQWAPTQNQVSHAYRLEKRKRSVRSESMPLKFASAHKIFFDRTIKVADCVDNLLTDEVERVDFLYGPEQARSYFNSWIGSKTLGEIPTVLSPGDVSTETQMVLANAAYFKGQWASQFDPKETKTEIFYASIQRQLFVNMMRARGFYNLTIDEALGAFVLQIPYLTDKEAKKDSEISMVIFLPPFIPNSLETLLAKLTPDTLEAALNQSAARDVEISLPKFAFEQNLELVPILRSMGVNSIFARGADLSGFSAESNLWFGRAKHVAKIKVDEEGRAVSAGAVDSNPRSDEPRIVNCNHPFLFYIYDHTAKAVLFAGIYRGPESQD